MAAVRSLPWTAAQKPPDKGRFAWIKELAGRIKAPAPLKNLASMPLTVAAAGCIDYGVFSACPVAGWIVTGLSLLGLEFLIADED